MPDPATRVDSSQGPDAPPSPIVGSSHQVTREVRAARCPLRTPRSCVRTLGGPTRSAGSKPTCTLPASPPARSACPPKPSTRSRSTVPPSTRCAALAVRRRQFAVKHAWDTGVCEPDLVLRPAPRTRRCGGQVPGTARSAQGRRHEARLPRKVGHRRHARPAGVAQRLLSHPGSAAPVGSGLTRRPPCLRPASPVDSRRQDIPRVVRARVEPTCPRRDREAAPFASVATARCGGPLA